MPAILNISTNLMFGAAGVWVLRQSVAVREQFVSWALLFILAVEALLVTPVVTYEFRFYPHWSMLYLFDPQLYPYLDGWVGPLSAVTVVSNFAAVIVGFAVARQGMLAKKLWIGALPLAVGAAIWLLMLVFFYDRIFFMGDYDTFWQGNATIIFTHFVGWATLLLYGALGTSLWWVHRNFASRDPSLI